MNNRIVLLVANLVLLTVPLAVAEEWDGGRDSEDKKHGTWSLFSAEKVLMEKVEYRHGVKHGGATLYYESGWIHSETVFRDGVQHGKYSSFYDDDSHAPAESGAFVDGHKSGKWSEKYQNGKYMSHTNYFNGRLEGAASYYFSSGEEDEQNVSSTAVYKNGRRTGEFTAYFDNAENSRQSSGQLNGELKTGLWSEWFANGQYSSHVNYVAGKMHGAAFFFYQSGQDYYSTSYSHDQLHGDYKGWFDNAEHTVQFEGAHRAGRRIGRWKEWFENAQLASDTNYARGVLNGPAAYYHDYDGSLDYSTVFLNEQHHGPYFKYHFPRPVQDALYDEETGELLEAPENVRQEFGRHEHNQRVGEWYTLHANGETRSVGTYEAGQHVGTWREYNEDGELSRIAEYDASGGLVSEQVNCDQPDAHCEG